MDSNGIEPAGHLHIAQAHEIHRPVRAVRIEPVAAFPLPSSSSASARLEPSVRRDAAPKVWRMVAGRVAGSIDFSADAPRPTGPAIPMYRHPADRNVAATGVGLGRLIDLDA